MLKISSELFAGLCLIFLGAWVRSRPSPSMFGFPVPRETGTFLFFAGIFFVVFVLLHAKNILAYKKKVKEDKLIVTCPECRESGFAGDMHGSMCPKCGTEVEELEGFYDRHPELREPDKKT